MSQLFFSHLSTSDETARNNVVKYRKKKFKKWSRTSSILSISHTYIHIIVVLSYICRVDVASVVVGGGGDMPETTVSGLILLKESQTLSTSRCWLAESVISERSWLSEVFQSVCCWCNVFIMTSTSRPSYHKHSILPCYQGGRGQYQEFFQHQT